MKVSKVQSIEKLLRDRETVVQPVSGTSMLPMLDEHTDAVKLITPNREIIVGDVVMYKSAGNRYTLHRVCKIEKNAIITRGDNCVSLEYVPKNSIVALMDGYIKNGKYIPADDGSYREYVKKVLDTGKPLIPTEWKYTVLLYKAAITCSEAPPAPEGVDWNKVIAVCEQQKISSAVATVITDVKPSVPTDVYRNFSESFNLTLRRTLLYDAERGKILSEMDEDNIRYLPLKGIIIKDLYPSCGMREFADNDILYDKSRQDDVCNIMVSLGYTVKSLRDIHDVYQKEPIFNFEMHRALFDEESPYAAFFSDILYRKNTDLQGNRMSDEDFYIYFLAHYAKHHNNAGSGLRPLGDLYLIQKHNYDNPAFDRSYVEASLEKLGLTGFEEQMLSVCNNLFSNGQIDDDVLRHIMSGGVYGNKTKSTINAIRSKGRLRYLFSRIFMPYRKMKTLFPILKSLPFLLPVCWVIRIVKATVNKEMYNGAKRELHILTKK